MAVTIKDIARELGVSPATVSLALNDSSMVNAVTAQRVKEAAERMGYVRNMFARSLVKGHSMVLALIVPDIENPFFASLVNQISIAAWNTGYELAIYISNDSQEKERALLRYAQQQNFGAILLAPVNSEPCTGEYRSWLSQWRGKPILFVGTQYDDMEFPCACIDIRSAVQDITRHMIESGADSLAILTGTAGISTLDLRCSGFTQIAAEANVPYEVWHADGVNYQEAYEYIIRRGRENLPRGIVCVSDMMALAVYNALSAWGINVPGDVMLSGLDDGLIANIMPMTLTTINPNLPGMAEIVIDMVRRLIAGERLIGNVYVEHKLKIRSSTLG